MKPTDLYTTAHLFVAAVRVLDHQEGAPPSLEAVCRLLDFSEEKGSYLLNRLRELKIVGTVNIPGNPLSRKVIYFHSLDALEDSFTSNGLALSRTEAFGGKVNDTGIDFFVAFEGTKK